MSIFLIFCLVNYVITFILLRTMVKKEFISCYELTDLFVLYFIPIANVITALILLFAFMDFNYKCKERILRKILFIKDDKKETDI